MLNEITWTGNCGKKECVQSCKPYWVQVDSHCFLWSKLQLSWAEAEDVCKNQGGHLASLTSEALKEKISDDFKTKPNAQTSMWIGGKKDKDEDGLWKWSDCSSWNSEASSKPLKEEATGNCLEFLRDGVDDWGANDCAKENYFLCSQKHCSGSDSG